MASQKASENPAKGITWDLSVFYKSITDPEIENDKSKLRKLVKEFITKYKGKINTKTPKANTIFSSLKDYENILYLSYKLGMYSSLLSSADTLDQKIKNFSDMVREFESEISSQLVWFDIEIKEISEEHFRNIYKDKKLKEYKYYLKSVRKYKPYTLSENEEILLVKKSQTSSGAFVRFFDEKTSYLRFPLKIKNKTRELTLSELTSVMSHDTERKTRIEASNSFTETFKNNEHFYTFTLNTLLLDKKISDEIRGYKYPQERTFLDYDVTPEIVEAMISSVTKSTKIVERYYNAKRKIQKLDKLHEWDRYSPLFPNSKKKLTWEDSKEKILLAFGKVDEQLNDIVSDFYENRWIDAELRPNKVSGAFCSYGTDQTNPFILCNYSGELGDLTTVAHELGHGMHGVLSAKNNSPLNMWPSTATAEIASIFAESLTFDLLMDELSDNKLKLNFLANKIEGMIASIHRQTEFYLFETDLHNHRKEKGELSSEEIHNYYQKRLQHMFGNSLELTDGHKYWWMYVSHFYHYNFYVFSYAFGELLSLSLYERYKIDGKDFTKKYIEALSAGGSKSPADIVKMMDMDIKDVNFWNKGLKLLSEYVKEFERLSSDIVPM